MKLRALLITVLLLAVLAGIGAGYTWWRVGSYLGEPIAELDEPVDVVVEPGTSLTRMVYLLAEQKLLQYPRILIYYLRVIGQTDLQAGEYRFEPGLTPVQLLEKLSRGEHRAYQVTLLEGWTFKQALGHLQAQEPLAKQLDPTDTRGLMVAIGVDPVYSSPEGLFFPDTYSYVRGMSDLEVLQTSYRKMQAVLKQQWPNRVADLPITTPYEALVLASIVEKETAVDSEREMISGVFVGRLRKGMRLQTDPTVIYAMGDSYQGNIRSKDLQIDSPFNTYRVAGLPPTPIALPSARSIEAALHPEATNKVFFVARGDGSHQFSETLEEHNRAVREYQIRNRAKNYRSVPQ
jgi:UPF0755 protein